MVGSTITKNLDGRHSIKEKSAEKEASILEILHKDHLKVTDMLFQFDQLENEEEKQTLVQKIVRELFVHSTVESEIVYSAVRKEASKDSETEDLIDEAETEHHTVSFLMAELLHMQPEDDFYDAKVCVLGELVRHHVREEEKNMFTKMKEADMDLEKLGQKFLTEKEEKLTISEKELAQELQDQLQEKGKPTRKRKKNG